MDQGLRLSGRHVCECVVTFLTLARHRCRRDSFLARSRSPSKCFAPTSRKSHYANGAPTPLVGLRLAFPHPIDQPDLCLRFWLRPRPPRSRGAGGPDLAMNLTQPAACSVFATAERRLGCLRRRVQVAREQNTLARQSVGWLSRVSKGLEKLFKGNSCSGRQTL